MLDFNTLLRQINVDLTETLIVRHFPVEPALRKVLPWLVLERPELWLAYQRIQWMKLEKAMARAKFIASFIGQQPGAATFAGLYRIGAHQVFDHAGYRSFPGNAELEALGMSEREPDMEDCLAFDLEALEQWDEWLGRLTVRWPKPAQSWYRWADRNIFLINTIESENLFVPSMPSWRDLVVGWTELQSLPASWAASLSQWRGIYYIHDTARRQGYIGSASGADNILGRWSHYAASGHGGNVELRESDPRDLQFSILERTSPDLDVEQVLALETSWKLRLHTREFGLNRN